MNNHSACFHCGLPIPKGVKIHRVLFENSQVFCCLGCATVAESICEMGLENYYLDRSALATTPNVIPEALSRLQQFDHPDSQQEFVHYDNNNIAFGEFVIEHITCAACVWLIESRLKQIPGVIQSSVNLSTKRLHIEWHHQILQPSTILYELEHIGYPAKPYKPDQLAQQLHQESQQLLKRLGVAAIGMMQVMMYAGSLYVGNYNGIEDQYKIYLDWVSLFITTPIFFYAGWPFYRSAWNAVRNKHLTMHVSVSLALAAAFFASAYATITQQGQTYFDSVTMFIFFLLAGQFLETRIREKSTDHIAQLLNFSPQLSSRVAISNEPLSLNNPTEWVSHKDIRSNDLLLIKMGEIISVDGVIVFGESAINEAQLTGESVPIPKKIGDPVNAGSINCEHPLIIKVQRTPDNSTLHAINRLLQRAHSEKPKQAETADKLAQLFVAIVLILTAAVFFIWSFYSNSTHAFWISISVLVATCPCALSIATPFSLSNAMQRLAQEGFLISRGHVLSSLGKITHVVLDKTGTLTQGQLTLKNIVLNTQHPRPLTESEVLALVCNLEQQGTHPIARCFQKITTEHLTLTNIAFTTGGGVSGIWGNRHFYFGNAVFIQQKTPTLTLEPNSDGLFLADESGICAHLFLHDPIRPQTASFIHFLQKQNLKITILSGDPSSQAVTLAEELHINTVHKGLTPADKQAYVKHLQEQGDVVLMIGDGVNDAPVMAQADISIAMASGTDLAQVSSDALLLNDDLLKVSYAYIHAKKTQRIIFENLLWALLYNISILPLAAFGFILPWMAALGMSLSSLFVMTNSLRLQVLAKPKGL